MINHTHEFDVNIDNEMTVMICVTNHWHVVDNGLHSYHRNVNSYGNMQMQFEYPQQYLKVSVCVSRIALTVI